MKIQKSTPIKLATAPRSAPAAPAQPSAARLQADRFRARTFVAQQPAPHDGVWYMVKKAFIDWICNIDFRSPKLESLTESTAFKVQPLMRPGDILLRRTEGSSGNFFIPSWWKHAAIYTGHGEVVEATFAGVQQNKLEDFFTHGDHVMILRPKDSKRSDGKAVARWAEAQVGKPYDFDVNFKDRARLMCTELVYHALNMALGKELVAPSGLTQSVVSDDFVNSENFELIWVSKEGVESNG